MTDRELIELAAKAAAIDGKWSDDFGKNGMLMLHNPTTYRLGFNPLIDDGDALRLAVKLQLEIYIDHRGVAVRTHCGLKVLERGCDASATRLAILRAAAEIGKGMA